jgi:hypothetical protein
MCDAVMGVLVGVVLMALSQMAFMVVKSLWNGEYRQAAGVAALTGVTVLVATFPVVAGLLVLLALCVGGFLLLVSAGSNAYRQGSFFGGYCCFELAGDVLKLGVMVLVTLLQAVSDASSKG